MTGVVASRNYFTGDVIYREEAFSKVLFRSFKDKFCESCEKRHFFLRACKQCLRVKYCGKECQSQDWKFHKLECKRMGKLPEDSNFVDMVRLLGNIILKIKGKDWKNVKKQVFGKDFSFADINSYSEDILEDPRRQLLVKEVQELVGNFIGIENMPSEEDFIEIFGKVEVNMVFTDRCFDFFIGFSKFDKVCAANSNRKIEEHKVKVWATKNIKKGTGKISTYCVRVASMDRTKIMHIGIACRCTDCSLPYGESVLTKVLDQTKAFSVITATESVLRLASLFPEICFRPAFRERVEIILRNQENVLGSNNILRMKLLALQCFETGDHPMRIRPALMELEKAMRSVFGECFYELQMVYETLGFVHFQLDEPMEGLRYLEKANQILRYNTSL